MSDFYCETCCIDTGNIKDTATVKEYDSDFVLYSTGCPKCNVLEKKLKSKNVDFVIETDILKSKNVDFVIETDIDSIVKMGYTSAPILWYRNSDKYYTFAEAVNFVNNII